jgi:hypothetical protein
MLGRQDYTKEELDHARAAVDQEGDPGPPGVGRVFEQLGAFASLDGLHAGEKWVVDPGCGR